MKTLIFGIIVLGIVFFLVSGMKGESSLGGLSSVEKGIVATTLTGVYLVSKFGLIALVAVGAMKLLGFIRRE